MSHFVFALTNEEAEPLLKKEISYYGPEYKLSYSRPGFLTFKSNGAFDFRPKLARITGLCHGKKTLSELLKLSRAWVWKRTEDLIIPNELKELSDKTIFKIGELVTLIMIVDANEFWLGEYKLLPTHFQTPGEVSSIMEVDSPSRAYYKIAEAFEAFDLPFENQEKVLELGSAPGGATQFLLEQDMFVLGVDPAEMDPKIKKHPNFKHIKQPFESLRRDLLPTDIDWIISDINLPPNIVLKEVYRLLEFIEARGVVLTLKLNQDRFVETLRQTMETFKKKGFAKVEIKYLPSHRQEIALIAIHS
jgi:23S rRNA (cytidine2498-2'-O)-methyltransferase